MKKRSIWIRGNASVLDIQLGNPPPSHPSTILATWGVSESILLALVPLAGYWLAFIYESGYCHYFNVPLAFVDVGIQAVLGAIVGAGTAALAIFNFYDSSYTLFLRRMPRVLAQKLLMITSVYFLMAGVAIVNRAPAVVHLVLLGIFVYFCFFEFGFPLISQKHVDGYLSKLEAQRKLDHSITTITDMVGEKIGWTAMMAFILLLCLSSIGYIAGGYSALQQTEFAVLSGIPESVVLKTNEAYYVAAEFNRTTHTILPSYQVIPRKDRNVRYTWEKLGRLTPKQDR